MYWIKTVITKKPVQIWRFFQSIQIDDLHCFSDKSQCNGKSQPVTDKSHCYAIGALIWYTRITIYTYTIHYYYHSFIPEQSNFLSWIWRWIWEFLQTSNARNKIKDFSAFLYNIAIVFSTCLLSHYFPLTV